MRTRGKGDIDMRAEYDLAEVLKGGVRGKYAKEYKAGTNLVLLEPEIRKQFKSEKDVNDALRLVLELRKIGGRRSGKP
ncbi:MAG: hypothetical protein U0R19_31155 [Bryobacteraceae bacterium]